MRRSTVTSDLKEMELSWEEVTAAIEDSQQQCQCVVQCLGSVHVA